MQARQTLVVIPEAFNDLFDPEHARYRIAFGGRGSAKSWTFCAEIILRCLQRTTRVLCTREFQNSISDSVYRLLVDQIERMEVADYFEITQTEIRARHNKSLIIFKGLRDAQSIKSTEAIDICFIEEAAVVSQSSLDLIVPTIRAPDSEIWMVFNPLSETDPVYKRFVLNPPKNALVKKINFDANPFFPQVLREEMEHMEATDYQAYRHVWLGECRNMSEASVFRDRWEIKEFDDRDVIFFYFGLDWGFAQDPTAIIRCFIKSDDSGKECLWIDHEAFAKHCELDHTPALINTVPRSQHFLIYADNARPESISFLQRHGYPNMRETEKWKGSVEDGLAHLRAFHKIYIHPRCKEVIFEMRNYSYKIDPRTNEVLPQLVDRHNHGIDAIRYALTRMIPRRGIPSQYEKMGRGNFNFM